ncbi:MAG TPA: hypothetical protein VF708_09100 [Pyrinomonadaceae bacterium]|jgi:hypothetical protein
MKSILFILTLVIFSLPITFPHSAKSNTNLNSIKPTQKVLSIYELGDTTVEIPAPEGFEEISAQLKNIRNRFDVTEDVNNEVLAVHLPGEIANKLKRGEPAGLTFYTKISVPKRVKEKNFTSSEFAQIVSLLKSNNKEILDINSPKMQSAIKNMEQNLSELNDKETKINFSQPINLGEIESGQNVYGLMLLLKMNPQIGGKQGEVLLLCGATFVRVKQRVIYVYTYRRFQSSEDVDVLKSFTKRWVGQIMAANQE